MRASFQEHNQRRVKRVVALVAVLMTLLALGLVTMSLALGSRIDMMEFHEELLYETVTVVLVSPRDLQASVAVVLVFEAGRPLGPVRKCDSCPALSVGKFVAVVLNGLSLANKQTSPMMADSCLTCQWRLLSALSCKTKLLKQNEHPLECRRNLLEAVEIPDNHACRLAQALLDSCPVI
ncbi:unnamed protein product [Heligmosomoides polygyrus]|uniref:Saposin B-type domain-containing protein n=1 Tax=Heligmosomoides polygyrus TaxID=6339 RepID=A0A3P7XPI0_HELPZ|nr:unnamed protein product [Heligmosomoides polygyrus]